MTAIFEVPIQSETLSQDEISEISGCSRKGDQVEWLTSNRWIFFKNRAGTPVVGRLYARMRLSGINPMALASAAEGWQLDVSKVR